MAQLLDIWERSVRRPSCFSPMRRWSGSGAVFPKRWRAWRT